MTSDRNSDVLEKAYLDQLVESVQEAIVLSENDGSIIQTNQAFYRLFGYSPEEVIGKNIDKLVTLEENLESAVTITQNAAAGKNIAIETKRRTKDGTLIDVSVLASPIIIEGEQFACYGIYRDISDRKNMEKDLRLNKERFEALYENVPIGIYLTTPDGNIIEANQALIKMLGFKSFEELSKTNLEKTGYGKGYRRKDFIEALKRDGLEATIAIRKNEEKTGKHVPIIAMTAHAMKEDKRKCFEAGMDEYLTKPLNPKELFDTIETKKNEELESRESTNIRKT